MTRAGLNDFSTNNIVTNNIVKLTPFADYERVANMGCGGTANNEQPAKTSVATFVAGTTSALNFSITLPHNGNGVGAGPNILRVALHYSECDSFEDNKLVQFTNKMELLQTGVHQLRFVVPAGKFCDNCVLQWMWASEPDGGFYIGCADVKITNSAGTAGDNTVKTATATFLPGDGIVGHISFSQCNSSSTTKVSWQLNKDPSAPNAAGANMPHKWHVHLNPVKGDSSLSTPIASRCRSTGGHFNPLNIPMASYADTCQPTNQTGCEVGDMTGKHGPLMIDGLVTTKLDLQLPLSGPNTIVGRSVAVHSHLDPANRFACADIVRDSPTSPGDASLLFQGQSLYFQKTQQLADTVHLYWSVENGGKDLKLAVKMSEQGWLGFGFNPSNAGMVGAQVVVGWLDPANSANTALRQYQLTSKSLAGLADKTADNILGLETGVAAMDSAENGGVVILIKRPITGASFVWATGPLPATAASSPPQHGAASSGRGAVKIDFATGVAITVDNSASINAHATLMTLAWGVLLPAGLIIARFYRAKGWWFKVHLACQAAGLLLSFVGFCIAVGGFATGTYKGHAFFGWLLMLVGLGQAIGGKLRPGFKDGNAKGSQRRKWETWHRRVGRVTVGVGFLQLFIGVDIHTSAFFKVWVALLFLAVAAWFGSLEWKSRRYFPNKPGSGRKDGSGFSTMNNTPGASAVTNTITTTTTTMAPVKHTDLLDQPELSETAQPGGGKQVEVPTSAPQGVFVR
eukprot:CAMPEP_0175123458 /NCGR_PEP_ID=MMETSP0087-20121206/2257_1 /TAXON_ID=136419 /ORGANISM="Unknown Unknown, Strain D1" /LENGTH=742 /DNA_ID=CAMNT_0016405157 /DNA_START=24 /DNA_END=2252 /DNA_ORIENTATION=-